MYIKAANLIEREAMKRQLLIARTAYAAESSAVQNLMKELS